MSNIFPGALWVPVPGQEKRAKRRKGRGVGYHVAVHEGPSIEKVDEGTGNDSHLYVRFDGSLEQNIDLDLVSYAMVGGNSTLITVETEGGVAHPERGITANNQPWTPAQVVTNARIARWAHDSEGVPLQLMPDSKPASRGLAPHRLGIQHSRGVGAVPGWLIAGGERWSTALGKECPGDAKVAQMPQILQLALSGDDDMTPDQANQLQQLYNAVFTGGPSLPGGLPLPQATAFAVWWGTTVTRADENGKAQQVPVIQELADAKSQALAANAALSSVVSEFASAKGLDPAAVGAAVEAAVAKALQNNTVHVDVNVGGQS